MKKLSNKAFMQISDELVKHARPLERAIFIHDFYNGTKEDILSEILKFQNEDGGFGKGLESDIKMPYSSPKATSIGIRHLTNLDELQEAQEAIKRAIRYLERSFDHAKNRWFIGSREINDYPHGPWWHFNELEGMTQLDLDWGNPNAEIIAYFDKYRQYVTELDVDKLIEHAIVQIENKKVFRNEYKEFVESILRCNPPEYVSNYFKTTKVFDPKGEVLCYIRLLSRLTGRQRERLEDRIREAVAQMVVYDEHEWEIEYVPMPLDFASGPKREHFGVREDKIESNLDLFIRLLEAEGKMNLKWAEGRGYYSAERAEAGNEWVWVFTLGALYCLSSYGRIIL